MFVVDGKKIKLIIVCIIVGFLAFSVQTLNMNEDIKIIKTAATPVTGKTVIIDAGHGIPDYGASTESGVMESEINLEIALQVQKLLEQSGCTVILTRSDENSIHELDKDTIREKKNSDLQNRVKIGNDSQADIFVSIHLNKAESSSYSGWQCFYNTNNENSKKLSESIQSSLNNSINPENQREILKLDNIYIMENIEIPISIVECGFLSNPEEEKLLQEQEYQEKIAWGIFIGINNYFYL